MQGVPVARATSPNGRFVYTLYQNPGGYPFVHALDTVRGVAHCVGLPWHGGQVAIGALKLSLSDGGRTLVLARPRHDGDPAFRIDTRSYRLLPAPRGGGFPWWSLSLAALLVPAAVTPRLRRRRARA